MGDNNCDQDCMYLCNEKTLISSQKKKKKKKKKKFLSSKEWPLTLAYKNICSTSNDIKRKHSNNYLYFQNHCNIVKINAIQ